MFGHKAKPSRIYSYGALEPVTNLAEIQAQMRLAHNYRNNLVALERERRDASQALLLERFPVVAELTARSEQLKAQLEEARAAIKSANQAIRGKSRQAKKDSPAVQLKSQLSAVYKELKAERAKAWEDESFKASLETIENDHKEKCQRLRAESGLYWGNYMTVEQALGKIRSGPPPRFRSWRGDGKIAIQIQKGMSVADLFAGKDTRFRLDSVPPHAFDKGQPQKLQRTSAYLRIGSDGRRPVWAVVPIVFHRPIPEDCRLKWVYLTSRRIATHNEWQLHLVLEREAGWDRPDWADSGRVGIDLGWRVLPNGSLRVAYWVGDDGKEGEVVFSARDVTRWQRADTLRSTRDSNFNESIAALRAWMANQADLPEWFKEETSSIHSWKSPSRLAVLVLHWREQRMPNDHNIYEVMEAWRKQDRHLVEWECCQRVKASRWRDSLFRNFAAQLRRQYRTAVIENTNWAKMAALPAPEEDKNVMAPSRYYQRVAAVGRLAECIRESMCKTLAAPAQNTTQRCHACQHLNEFDAATCLTHQCDKCGATWDQDKNAAINLLNHEFQVAEQAQPDNDTQDPDGLTTDPIDDHALVTAD